MCGFPVGMRELACAYVTHVAHVPGLAHFSGCSSCEYCSFHCKPVTCSLQFFVVYLVVFFWSSPYAYRSSLLAMPVSLFILVSGYPFLPGLILRDREALLAARASRAISHQHAVVSGGTRRSLPVPIGPPLPASRLKGHWHYSISLLDFQVADRMLEKGEHFWGSDRAAPTAWPQHRCPC